MVGETPVPQNLSSEVAKAGVVPDVLKRAQIDWNRVKKIDAGLDKIPEIHARGALIRVDEQPDAEGMRKATQLKVADHEDTNLVDYVKQDEQLRVLLQEGMRLGVVSEASFKEVGIDPKVYMSGEKAGLQIPKLDSLQKADAINLILSGLGQSNDRTSTQFLDEASKLILDAKKVTLKNSGTLSNLTLLNALAANGREELSKYIVEKGYQPFDMKEQADERRVIAKLVKEGYSDEGVTKVLSEETPYFASSGRGKEGEVGKAEYSGVIDIHIAQAMTNAMLPPAFHLEVARLENLVRSTDDVAVAEDLRHQITHTKQIAYASLLNSFGVAGYEDNGDIYRKLGFSLKDQNDISRLAKGIKESARFKETQSMTMFEANRYSLSETAAKLTGVNADRLKNLVMAMPIEQTVEALREQARTELISEDLIESTIRTRLAESFTTLVSDSMGDATLSPENTDTLGRMFLNTYDTERSLLRKGHTRFENADAPTKVKIGTPEAINQGIKGLDLLFRRSVTEQQYDFKTYKQMLIEGAARARDDAAGATLEQGQEHRAEQEKLGEAMAADAVRAEQEKQGEAQAAAIVEEQIKMQANADFINKSPLESLARTDIPTNDSENHVYANELMLKIDQGYIKSDAINAEIQRMLNITKDFEGWFRGPMRLVQETRMLKTPEQRQQYADLKKALTAARQMEAVQDTDNSDELNDVREQLFVPKPPTPNP